MDYTVNTGSLQTTTHKSVSEIITDRLHNNQLQMHRRTLEPLGNQEQVVGVSLQEPPLYLTLKSCLQ